MTSEVVIAFIGIGFLVISNIIIVSLSYGKLLQGFVDVKAELIKLTLKVENTDTHLDKLTERIARMEGKLEKN